MRVGLFASLVCVGAQGATSAETGIPGRRAEASARIQEALYEGSAISPTGAGGRKRGQGHQAPYFQTK